MSLNDFINTDLSHLESGSAVRFHALVSPYDLPPLPKHYHTDVPTHMSPNERHSPRGHTSSYTVYTKSQVLPRTQLEISPTFPRVLTRGGGIKAAGTSSQQAQHTSTSPATLRRRERERERPPRRHPLDASHSETLQQSGCNLEPEAPGHFQFGRRRARGGLTCNISTLAAWRRTGRARKPLED